MNDLLTKLNYFKTRSKCFNLIFLVIVIRIFSGVLGSSEPCLIVSVNWTFHTWCNLILITVDLRIDKLDCEMSYSERTVCLMQRLKGGWEEKTVSVNSSL